jgi:hypothetical protein
MAQDYVLVDSWLPIGATSRLSNDGSCVWLAQPRWSINRESLHEILYRFEPFLLRSILIDVEFATWRLRDHDVVDLIASEVIHGRLTLYKIHRPPRQASRNASPSQSLAASHPAHTRTGDGVTKPAGALRPPPPEVKEAPLRMRLLVTVIGEDRQALPGVQVLLAQKGRQLKSKTDRKGKATFEGLTVGQYHVALSELDRDAWEVVSLAPLPNNEVLSSGDAPWKLREVIHSAETSHTLVQGECISYLAEKYGFETHSLWAHSINDALRVRRDSPFVLAPGDLLGIPKKQLKEVSVHTGSHLTLLRRGVPERLQVRFLLADGKPRANVEFSLVVSMAGRIVTEHQAKTDEEGFVSAWIEPQSDLAKITLGSGAYAETYHLKLGHLDPIDESAGLRARLHNLGFLIDGISDEDALKKLQKHLSLPETGLLDNESRSAILSMHNC